MITIAYSAVTAPRSLPRRSRCSSAGSTTPFALAFATPLASASNSRSGSTVLAALAASASTSGAEKRPAGEAPLAPSPSRDAAPRAPTRSTVRHAPSGRGRGCTTNSKSPGPSPCGRGRASVFRSPDSSSGTSVSVVFISRFPSVAHGPGTPPVPPCWSSEALRTSANPPF